jgi:hypothetical protein
MECGGSTPLWIFGLVALSTTALGHHLPKIQSGVEPPHSIFQKPETHLNQRFAQLD